MKYLVLAILALGVFSAGCSVFQQATSTASPDISPPQIAARSTDTPLPAPSDTPFPDTDTPTIPPPTRTRTPTAIKPPTPTATAAPNLPTASATPAVGKNPTSTAGAVLIAAGDMRNCNDGLKQVGALINTIPGTVLNLGDLTNTGAPSEYPCYDKAWGQFKDRTFPVVGNHEYLTKGATGYFGYWGDAAHGPGGYYSTDIGGWHIVVLNSNCSNAGGCQAGSAQEKWLKADLAAHSNQCTLAMWHHPRWNSGKQGNTVAVTPFLQDLYDANAHLVLNGHEHNYERFPRMDPKGIPDPKGIREFIVGTGGAGGGSWVETQPNSEVHAVTAYGVLKLTLHASSYDWQFIPTNGTTFTDSGSEGCK